MAAKNKVTVSVEPPTRRPSAVERRAAQTTMLAAQQATLKQEAADRRLNAQRPHPTSHAGGATPRAS